RCAAPLMPEPVKESDFARKVARRLSAKGRKIQSANGRWLAARIAAPEVGAFATPSATGRNSRRRGGPRTTLRSGQYSARPELPASASRVPDCGSRAMRRSERSGLGIAGGLASPPDSSSLIRCLLIGTAQGRDGGALARSVQHRRVDLAPLSQGGAQAGGVDTDTLLPRAVLDRCHHSIGHMKEDGPLSDPVTPSVASARLTP